MNKILKHRDFFYILILFIWFLYPRQDSVRKETKLNIDEIRKLEVKISELKGMVRTDSIKKISMLNSIDSLQKARVPIYNIIKSKDEQIENVLRSNDLPDSLLYRYFTNVKTDND